MTKSHIYPKKIRRFEKEIIDFIVESGKNKRSSDIESHILSYFFCHPSLTQKQIQDLSSIFRKDKISRGSISNFLNQYEKYGVISKQRISDKKKAFEYSLKNLRIKSLMSTGLESGLNELQNWYKYIEIRIKALNQIIPDKKHIEFHSILIDRLTEMNEFFKYHYNLMNEFFKEKIDFEELTINEIPELEVKKVKEKGIDEIEKEIIEFIQINPLFIINEKKYLPIYSYLITRKRLTQYQIRKLTKLSSGLVSEGLNHLLDEGFIQLEKIKGIRKRFYVMPSIAYSNYLKQYQRFRLIFGFKEKIEKNYQEMKKREIELKELDGYYIIFKWFKEVSDLFMVVELGLHMFEKALSYFKDQIK